MFAASSSLRFVQTVSERAFRFAVSFSAAGRHYSFLFSSISDSISATHPAQLTLASSRFHAMRDRTHRHVHRAADAHADSRRDD